MMIEKQEEFLAMQLQKPENFLAFQEYLRKALRKALAPEFFDKPDEQSFAE